MRCDRQIVSRKKFAPMLWVLLVLALLSILCSLDGAVIRSRTTVGNDSIVIRDNDILPRRLEILTNMLLDNKFYEKHHRKLQLQKIPYSSDLQISCSTCRGLKTCNILNEHLIQENYYPKNTALRETCNVIETFANRIKKQIFGEGTTFRDTPQCQEMVMQYLCLFYGSDNPMYTNYCVFNESTVDPDTKKKVLAQRPPCHSYCVQVAIVCANDPDIFLQTCSRIACPPIEDECTPDPIINGQPVVANLKCSIPYYNSPYFRAAAPFKSPKFNHILTLTILALLTIQVLYYFL